MTGTRGPRSKRTPRAGTKEPSGDGAPALPDGYDPRTIAWWEALLALPHVGDFLAADWQVALRGAFVLELIWTNPTSAFLTELRRIEASLGMTKGDRDRLGVVRAPRVEQPTKTKRPDQRLNPT